VQVEVEVEYVPEKPELEDSLLDDFKAIFDKFTFKDTPATAAEVLSPFSISLSFSVINIVINNYFTT
jgi:hypothetical protein